MLESTTSSEWLTPADIAARLQVSPDCVIDMAKRGQLPALKVGRLYRFLPETYESLKSNIGTAKRVEAVKKIRQSSRRFARPTQDEFADL